MDPIARARNGDTNFFKRVPVDYFHHVRAAHLHSVLSFSIQEDHLLCSKVIVERCPSLLNEVDAQWRHTPLHTAAIRGVPEIVKLLADAAEKRIFMITDDQGCTPLHLAVENENFEAFKLLLEAFPDHESHFEKRGLKPLLWFLSEQTDEGRSSSHDLVKIRKLYLEKFPRQCNLKTGDRGWTPLHFAASKFQLDAIEDIINFCPDCIHLVDNEGNNLLHIAADLDFYEVVKYVLQTKEILADSLLKAQNNDGMTPLDIAVNHGDKRMLKCLNITVNYDDDDDEEEQEDKGMVESENDSVSPRSQHDLYELLVKQFGNILQSAEPDSTTSFALSGLLSLVDEIREIDEDDVSEEQMSEWENKVTEYTSLGLEVSWLNEYLSLLRGQYQERRQLMAEMTIKEEAMERVKEEYLSLDREFDDLQIRLDKLTCSDYFAFLDE